MLNWSPIDEKALFKLISSAEWILEGLDKGFWRLIKLSSPEKWKQHPHGDEDGDEGDGFWVVAIFGNRCIYYNDIEDGFNISTFGEWGTIDEYWCNQSKLEELVSNIVASRFIV
jgi:hypothetical protein